MEKYDWEERVKKTRNPTKVNWVWNNHKKEISEDVYIKEIKSLMPFATITGKKKSRRYASGNLRKEYNYLKSTFGFFTGKEINN